MDKETFSFEEGELKPYWADQAQNEKCWSLACAKIGHPEAAKLRTKSYCGTKAQVHENLKYARRALNAIMAQTPSGQFPPDVQTAFDFGSFLVSSLASSIDDFEMRDEKTKPSSMKALRTAADFAKHYKAKDQLTPAGEDGLGLAEFMRGVANMTTTPAVRNALTVGTDTAGGFAVPSRLMPGILSALAPVSSLLQAGASIVPIEDGAKSFTTAAINAIPTAAWRAESGVLATSDATFRAVLATPRSCSFQFKMSRELLADGQNITEALYIAIAQSFARELDRVGLLGSGTAPEPRGVLNTSGIQTVANGVNGAALASYANIFSAAQAILQADAPMPTAAIMSPRSLIKLGGLTDTTTQPMRVPVMLEKLKLIGTSQISNALTVGTSTDCSQIFVGDFTNLYFIMREAMSVQVLNELYAGTGEIGFACHMRADVALSYPAAFCVVTGVRP